LISGSCIQEGISLNGILQLIASAEGIITSIETNSDGTLNISADTLKLAEKPVAVIGKRSDSYLELYCGSFCFRICFGNTSITPMANTVTSQAITFPEGLFTGTPVVPYSSVKMISYSSCSNTGFDINIYRVNTQATSIGWIAVEMSTR